MPISLMDFFSAIAAFQFFFVAIILISIKKGKQLSNRILAAFLLAKASSLINSILIHFNVYDDYLHFLLIGLSFSYLYGPLLYFYIKSTVYKNFTIKKSFVIHLIPFMVTLVITTFVFFTSNTEEFRELTTTAQVSNFLWILIYMGFYLAQTLAYLIVSIYTLRIYRFEIKKTFSSLKNINLDWLSLILIGFFLIWINNLANTFFLIISGDISIFLSSLSLVYIFILANLVVYKGLKHPEIFLGIEERPKYEQSSLTKEESKCYLYELKAYVEKEKPYLTPSLTIDELAKNLSIPSKHLSQVINEHLNKNFFDFVNSYRVEEAKRYLLNSMNNHLTILYIAFEVGFNSKTAFNRAFKKQVGMSPTHFKKLHQI